MKVQSDPRLGFRALTVRQPWANEIAEGTKRVEFRSWSTPYRGDVLITVSASGPGHPRGCTLCVVELYDVEGSEHDYEWLLRNPRPVARLPVKGALKLWSVPGELVIRLGLSV